MTLALKACERCGGDMDLTSDPESYCINCGHRPEWAPVLSGHGAARNVRSPGSPPAELAKTPRAGGIAVGGRGRGVDGCKTGGGQEMDRLRAPPGKGPSPRPTLSDRLARC